MNYGDLLQIFAAVSIAFFFVYALPFVIIYLNPMPYIYDEGGHFPTELRSANL